MKKEVAGLAELEGIKEKISTVDLEAVDALTGFSQDPMLLLSLQGDVLYMNRAMYQLIGRNGANLQPGLEKLEESEEAKWQIALYEVKTAGYSEKKLSLSGQDPFKIPVLAKFREFTSSLGQPYISVHLQELRPCRREKESVAVLQQEKFLDVQFILDHATDLICALSPEGIFLQVNKASVGIAGYLPEEIIGKSYLDFIYPEDKPSAAGTVQQTVQGHRINNLTSRWLHKNGSLIYLSLSFSFSEEKNSISCIARDITKNSLVEKRQQEKKSRLEVMLQEGYDMICVIDKNYTYSYASGSTKHILGYEPEDLIGVDPFSLMHPQDVSYVLEDLKHVLKGDNVRTQPFRFKANTGEWRWIETKGVNCFQNPAINGILINSRDVTERLEAQRKLERSEKMYKALFENNPDCVYSLDKEGFFTSVNAATVTCSGYTEEELLRMNFTDILHPDWVVKEKTGFARSLVAESWPAETAILTSQGNKVYLAVTKIPVIVNGELIGIHGIAKDITESKQQQWLLANTANKLNNILDSIKDAFFTLDKNWCFTYVNPEFERAMGIKGEDLYGLDIRQVYYPAKFGNFYAHFTQTITLQHPVHFEEFLEYAGIWLDVSVYPSEDGLSVYIKGINARKKAEAELKKLSLVASKTVNSVYITDSESRIEWVNAGFTRVTGYTLEEAIGRKPSDFLVEPFLNKTETNTLKQNLPLDQPFVQEVQNRSKTGEVYWSKLDVTPIVDEHSGGAKKFIVIETVITEQKKAEEERLKLTEELLRRNHHLEQFTYIVSHNLRSPVANVLGLTSLLGNTESKEMHRGLTDRLRQTAQHLDTIIRDLNDLLTLEGGLLEAREKISLSQLVEQALNGLPEDSFHQVAINLNGIEEIESVRSYLTSILANLLSNAVKYKSPERLLMIEVRAQLDVETDMICLSVTDNGLGINLQKEEKNLFGLYKRFHFHVDGRGLGLYLVKTQAEALGGFVKVESEPDKGSTFNVWIKNSI